MTDVVVSIVNTSQCDLALACLESLHRDEGRRCSADVVVLDNASDDGSSAIIAKRYPTVRVIEQSYRAGFGANHNAVFQASASRYVLILNEDTEVPPGALDALVDFLDAHPGSAIVGPRIVGFDGRQQGSAWRLMTIPVQFTWAVTLGRRGAVVSHGNLPRLVGAVSACAMLVRRKAFEAIGLFDETFFIFSEEADSAKRLHQNGWEIHYLPSVDVRHHGQQSTSAVPERQINEIWRSMDRYLEKHHRPLEGNVLKLLTGFGYGMASLAAGIARRLPSVIRPASALEWDPAVYRLHARNSLRTDHAPGLRENAERWNRDHGIAYVPTERVD